MILRDDGFDEVQMVLRGWMRSPPATAKRWQILFIRFHPSSFILPYDTPCLLANAAAVVGSASRFTYGYQQHYRPRAPRARPI